MLDASWDAWAFALGQLATLAILIWNKIVQRQQGKVLEATHTLSNSAYGASLAAWAKSARLVADKTGLASDKQIAELAETMSNDHIVKQAIVDQAAQH